MKKFAFLAITLLLIISCSKNPAVVLPKNDGSWQFILTTVVKGSTTNTSTDAGTINFANDGSGFMKITGFNSVSFRWSATKENVVITFQGNTTFVYDVKQKGINRQVWERSEITGNVTLTETFKLTR